MVPILFFGFNFSGQAVSDDIDDWSAFAGYLNGTISVIISTFTLVVTIIIAVEISKIDDRRNEKNQKFEKLKLLREFREQEYKDIRNNLQSIFPALMSDDPREVNLIIHQVVIKYRYFMTSTYHLFPFLEEQLFLDLKSTLEKFSEFLEKDQEFVDNNKMKLFEEYVDNFDKFNIRIQTFLLKN
ncbi:hypothetical protein AAEO57_01800 [Flavobacterium sp. DGU38]|uniref:Phage abortive infection protein n=1 Tax=Flavobacterium calami TaxID=3139144 RepID=A0ABU9IJ78_9FLAO